MGYESRVRFNRPSDVYAMWNPRELDKNSVYSSAIMDLLACDVTTVTIGDSTTMLIDYRFVPEPRPRPYDCDGE